MGFLQSTRGQSWSPNIRKRFMISGNRRNIAILVTQPAPKGCGWPEDLHPRCALQVARGCVNRIATLVVCPQTAPSMSRRVAAQLELSLPPPKAPCLLPTRLQDPKSSLFNEARSSYPIPFEFREQHPPSFLRLHELHGLSGRRARKREMAWPAGLAKCNGDRKTLRF